VAASLDTMAPAFVPVKLIELDAALALPPSDVAGRALRQRPLFAQSRRLFRGRAVRRIAALAVRLTLPLGTLTTDASLTIKTHV